MQSHATVFMNTGLSQSVLAVAGVDRDRVLVDSGASIHATPRRELCFDVTSCSVSIAGVGGVAFRCVERGSLVFQPCNQDLSVLPPVILTDVHISSEFPTTFISESKLVRTGASVLKDPSGGQVTRGAKIIFRLCEEGGLYYAIGSLCSPPAADTLDANNLPSTPFPCQDVPAALCWLAKCDLNVDKARETAPQSLACKNILKTRCLGFAWAISSSYEPYVVQTRCGGVRCTSKKDKLYDVNNAINHRVNSILASIDDIPGLPSYNLADAIIQFIFCRAWPGKHATIQ